MKISHIDLGKHPILLAPMEDVTDPAFRLMCKNKHYVWYCNQPFLEQNHICNIESTICIHITNYCFFRCSRL